MNVLLIAEESVGIRLLQELSKLPYNIVAVMATEPPQSAHQNCVWAEAKSLGYQTWPAKWVKDPQLADRLRTAGVDVILNIHSLYIIREEVLSAAKIGAFNLHPGPLPQYAGLNAPSWAIYNDEQKHGVTLHKMEPGIDTGAIVFEQMFDVSEQDTGLSVALRCMQSGLPLILKLLHIASTDPEAIPYRPQQLSQRRYFGKEVPQKGAIIWERTARQVFNFLRASDYAPFPSPWGRPQTHYKGQPVSITKSALSGKTSRESPGTIMREDNGGFYVACSDEWLEIKKMFVAGRSVSPKECLAAGGKFDEV
jgi:methionyl-tRNA formyltransferase